MIKKYGDIIAGAVFLVVTAFYYQGTFIQLKFRLSKYGAEFVPRIYCLIMALVAVALIIRGVTRLLRGDRSGAGRPIDRQAAVKVLLSVAVISLYILTMEPLGFLLATILYLVLQVLVTAPRGRVRAWALLVFAAGVSCSLNYLFLHVFYLALPPGLLTF